jgi:nucleotide-binding universal stress UspA family protein
VLVTSAIRRVHAPFKKVIAAIDLSPAATRVLAMAHAVVDSETGRIRVLSIADIDRVIAQIPAELMLPRNEALTPQILEERYRVQIAKLVVGSRTSEATVIADVRSNGLPRDLIREVAREEEADLIVIGTSGHRAWQRFVLGSTAGYVAAEAPCAVVAISEP